MIPVFEMLDRLCADKLDITVEEFASKIESMTEKRAFIVLSALLNDDELKTEKAKRIFNNIKILK